MRVFGTDEIKFEGPPDALVWKIHKEDISLGTKLVVTDSQEAIFFSGGECLDVFTAGTHTLNAHNMSKLVSVVKRLFGQTKVFGSEIYFVNKTARLDYKWGTKSPFPVEDPQYKVLLSVGCFGQFGLRIKDSSSFITQISGSFPELRNDMIVDYFRGLILTRVQDTIAKALVQMNISVSSIIAYLDDISKATQERLNDEFAKYGLELLQFQVSSIRVPDEELERLRKGSFDKLEIDQIGNANYQLKRSFDLMETAAKNPPPASLLGGSTPQNIGIQMAQLMSQIDNAQDTLPTETSEPQGINPAGAVTGEAKLQLDAGVVECYKCHASAPQGAKFCSTCGESLAEPSCVSCGNTLQYGSAFCSNCGAKVDMATEQVKTTACGSCGNTLEAGTLFCPACGSSAG